MNRWEWEHNRPKVCRKRLQATSGYSYSLAVRFLTTGGMRMQPINLNDFHIEDHGSHLPVRNAEDNSTQSRDGSVRVYFRNLEVHLLRYLREARLVVGCIAWLTSDSILKA